MQDENHHKDNELSHIKVQQGIIITKLEYLIETVNKYEVKHVKSDERLDDLEDKYIASHNRFLGFTTFGYMVSACIGFFLSWRMGNPVK